MALIVCPYCGKQISEKATKCVHCGNALKAEPANTQKCPECDADIPEDMDVCPNCGCPIEKQTQAEPQKVEVTNVKLAMGKKHKKALIISLVLIVLIILGVVGSSIVFKQSKKKEYAGNYKRIVDLMIFGAAEAESTGGLIHDVWYNTIYEKDNYKTDKYTKDLKGKFYEDFNDSLHYLMISDEYTTSKEEIEENQEKVQALMKELTNPPEEYKEAYAVLKDFYDAYSRLVNLAINPTGSLTSYTSNFNEADTDTVNQYKTVLLYVED